MFCSENERGNVSFYMYFYCEQEIISFLLQSRFIPFSLILFCVGSQYPQMQELSRTRVTDLVGHMLFSTIKMLRTVENINLFKMFGFTNLGYLIFVSLSQFSI